MRGAWLYLSVVLMLTNLEGQAWAISMHRVPRLLVYDHKMNDSEPMTSTRPDARNVRKHLKIRHTSASSRTCDIFGQVQIKHVRESDAVASKYNIE